MSLKYDQLQSRCISLDIPQLLNQCGESDNTVSQHLDPCQPCPAHLILTSLSDNNYIQINMMTIVSIIAIFNSYTNVDIELEPINSFAIRAK